METRYLYNKTYLDKLNKQSCLRIIRLLKYIDFKKSDVVADIGCGDGKLAQLICNDIKEYNGVDFSPLFISLAKKINSTLLNANFICSKITDFCYNNNLIFDKVFTLDFSEHVDDFNFSKIYTAIYNSMKENGELIIHTPNRDFVLEWLKEIGILKQFPEHIAVRNTREYFNLLNKIGFRNINVIFLSHYILVLRFFHLFTFIPSFGKFFKARLLIICQKWLMCIEKN